jgi:malonate transporter and related proteins
VSEVLATVFPVFALIALGFAARRLGAIGDGAVDGMSAYVYVLALPALLFRTVATVETPGGASPWAYWFTFFSGVAGTWVLVSLIARRGFGRPEREAVMAGFTAAQANTVMVGIPLIVTIFGPAGAVPIVLLLAVHLPVNMLVATLLIEAAGDKPLGQRLATFALSVARHPILLVIFAGVL